MTSTDPTQDPQYLRRVPTLLNPDTPVAAGAPPPSPQPQLVPLAKPTPNQRAAQIPMPQIGQPGESPRARDLRDLQEQGSRISRIHNPVGRTLASIGDAILGTFAPRAEALIPGTEGNYAMKLNRAERAADLGEKRQLEQAQEARAREEAESQLPLRQAQTEEAQARAESLRNPKPTKEAGTVHEDKEGNMWVVHPDGTATAVAPQGGSQLQGKTPEEKTGTVHEDKEGNMWIVKGDGTATPVTPKGSQTQLQGKAPAEKTENAEQQFVDEYRKANPKATVAEAQRAFKKNEQLPPQTDRGQNFVVNGRMIRVEPGGAVPAGAVAPSGFSQENVKTAEQEQAATKARADAQKEYQLAQNLASHPSPTNDVALVMRYIGATKPDSLGKLRLNQNEINLVLGTRSTFGDVEALAQKVVNGQRLTPQQRKDMLESMRILGGLPETGGSSRNTSAGSASIDDLVKRHGGR